MFCFLNKWVSLFLPVLIYAWWLQGLEQLKCSLQLFVCLVWCCSGDIYEPEPGLTVFISLLAVGLRSCLHFCICPHWVTAHSGICSLCLAGLYKTTLPELTGAAATTSCVCSHLSTFLLCYSPKASKRIMFLILVVTTYKNDWCQDNCFLHSNIFHV